MIAPVSQHQRILVVGGGIAGTSAALALRRLGHSVDLVEQAARWNVPDMGVWLSGATFRALDRLGLLDDATRLCHTTAAMRVCNDAGNPVAELPAPPPVENHLPASGGVRLPALHALIADAARHAGVTVRLGETVERIAQDGDVVNVTTHAGTTAAYDLVVGADGIRSRVRESIFPGAASVSFAGQHLWRAILPADARIDCRHVFSGGTVKVGLSPLPDGRMYLFLLQVTGDARVPADGEAPMALRDLLRDYRGVVADARDAIGDDTPVVVRPLETLSFGKAWFEGRVVLVGDAVHPTTPQLAAGIGLSIEDAVVLAERLSASPTLPAALDSYMTRRFKRCRRIVENSHEIVRRQNQGSPAGPVNALVEQSQRMLGEPA